MGSKVIIRDLSAHSLEKTSIKCVGCSFWFDYNGGCFLDDIFSIKSFLDIKNLLRKRYLNRGYIQKRGKQLMSFADNGGIVKGAFKDKKCVGLLTAGDFGLFPKLQSFRIFPPDNDCTFLGCIYVVPGERGLGIEKMLLNELEKDLLRKNAIAIETIGKRLDDDMDGEEFENSPLVTFKFLIKNGFYLKKNDEKYPLLRLDIKSIAREPSWERVSLEKLAYKKTVRYPVVMKEK